MHQPGGSESNYLSLFPPLSPCFSLLVFIILISLSFSLFHRKFHLFCSCLSPWLDLSCQPRLCLYPAWTGTAMETAVCSPPDTVPRKMWGVCVGRVGAHTLWVLGRHPKEPVLPSVPTLPAGPAHQSSAIPMETSSRLPIGGQEGRGRGREGLALSRSPPGF